MKQGGSRSHVTWRCSSRIQEIFDQDFLSIFDIFKRLQQLNIISTVWEAQLPLLLSALLSSKTFGMLLSRCWDARPLLSIVMLFLLHSAVEASISPSCAHPNSAAEHCSVPLEDITEVDPGRFIVAKLQCYGCPTTARLETGGHKITHEKNALVY